MSKAESSALSRKLHLAHSLSPSAIEFIAGELIGEKAKVEKASSKDFQGIEGSILDETKNTFVFQTAKGRKIIPKSQCAFRFENGVVVEGKILVSRPEDRTRKIVRVFSKMK